VPPSFLLNATVLCTCDRVCVWPYPALMVCKGRPLCLADSSGCRIVSFRLSLDYMMV
jgi:hypothetical protein